MNITLTSLALIAVVAAFFVVGCTSNKPFRTSLAACDASAPGADCTRAVIENWPGYKLGFVEFDDQGWFWNRQQLKAVEHLIQTEAETGRATDRQGVVIIVFVHGWKNNAAYDNENVEMFRKTLQQFSTAETLQTNRPAKKIVGVYAAWRGLSAKWWPFEDLSFWERKNTAHKVGGYGAMTELLVDLEKLQQLSNAQLATNAPRTELIIVGHSFGGAAVYSALSEIVTERFVDTVEHGAVLKPLGDQVILLNPAFEASRHYNLNQLAISISNYPAAQRPVLSIFTSQGDWATHYAFPIGRFFSTMFEKNRDQMQGEANRDAVGWFKPFITHDLVYNTNSTAEVAGNSTFNAETQKHELHSRSQLQFSIKNVQEQRLKWHPNAPSPATYYFDDSILAPRHNFRPGDPILVVSVDKRIMKDHDDITNPVLINFLSEYILFCRVNQ